MARDVKDVLRRLVAELDDEDAIAELEALKERVEAGATVTPAMIRQALAEAPEDERAELRAYLRELLELEDAPPPPPPGDPPPPPPPPGDPPPPPPPSSTRPGRKSGNAYSWDVDDDGRVVQLGVARVYNGADEPDEVELPPDEPPPVDEPPVDEPPADE